jgi:hypothetical protein
MKEQDYNLVKEYIDNEISENIPDYVPLIPSFTLVNAIHFNLWDIEKFNNTNNDTNMNFTLASINISCKLENSHEELKKICEGVLNNIITLIENKNYNINWNMNHYEQYIIRQIIMTYLSRNINDIENIINDIISKNIFDINNSMTLLYQFSNCLCLFEVILTFESSINIYIEKYGITNFIEIFFNHNKGLLKGPLQTFQFIRHIKSSNILKTYSDKFLEYFKTNLSDICESDKPILKHYLTSDFSLYVKFIPVNIQDQVLSIKDYYKLAFVNPNYEDFIEYFNNNGDDIVSEKFYRIFSSRIVREDLYKKFYDIYNKIKNKKSLTKLAFDPYLSSYLYYSKDQITLRYMFVEILYEYECKNEDIVTMFEDINTLKTINIGGNEITIDILDTWGSLRCMYIFLNDKILKCNNEISFKTRVIQHHKNLINIAKNNSDDRLYVSYCLTLSHFFVKYEISDGLIELLMFPKFLTRLVEYKSTSNCGNFVTLSNEILKFLDEKLNEKLILISHFISAIYGSQIDIKYIDKDMVNFSTIICDNSHSDNDNENEISNIILQSEKFLHYITEYFDIEYIISKFTSNEQLLMKIGNAINGKEYMFDIGSIIMKYEKSFNEEKTFTFTLIKNGSFNESFNEEITDLLLRNKIINSNHIIDYIHNKYDYTNSDTVFSLLQYSRKNNINIDKYLCFRKFVRYDTNKNTFNLKCMMEFIHDKNPLNQHTDIINIFDDIQDNNTRNNTISLYINTLVAIMNRYDADEYVQMEQYENIDNITDILYMKIITEYIDNEYVMDNFNDFISNYDLRKSKFGIARFAERYDDYPEIVSEFISSIMGIINMDKLYNEESYVKIIEKMVKVPKYTLKIGDNILSNLKKKLFGIALKIITPEYWTKHVYDINTKTIKTNLQMYISVINLQVRNLQVRNVTKINFLKFYLNKNGSPSLFNELKRCLSKADFMQYVSKHTVNILRSFDKTSSIRIINEFIKICPNWLMCQNNIRELYNLLSVEHFKIIICNNMEIICKLAETKFENIILISDLADITIDTGRCVSDFSNDALFIKCYNKGLLKCDIETIIKSKQNLIPLLKLNDTIALIIIKFDICDINMLWKLVTNNLANPLVLQFVEKLIDLYDESSMLMLSSLLNNLTINFQEYISAKSLEKIKHLVKYDYDLLQFIRKCGVSMDEIIKYKYNDRNLVLCSAIHSNIDIYGKYINYIPVNVLFEKDILDNFIIENIFKSEGGRKILENRDDYSEIKQIIIEKNIFLENETSLDYMMVKIKNYKNMFIKKCKNEQSCEWLNDFDNEQLSKLLLQKDSNNNYGLFYVAKYYPDWFEENIINIFENIIGNNLLCNKFGETFPMYLMRYSPKCYAVMVENNLVNKDDCYISTTKGSLLTYSAKYCNEYFPSILDSNFISQQSINIYDTIDIIDFYTEERLKFKTVVNLVNILIVKRRENEFNILLQKNKNSVKKHIQEIFSVNGYKYNSFRLALFYCPKIAFSIINSNIVHNSYFAETFSYMESYDHFRLIGTIQPESWVYLVETKNPEIIKYKKHETNINNIYGVRLNGNFIIESKKGKEFIKTIKNTQIYEYSNDNQCKVCFECKETLIYTCGHRLCVNCHVMRLWEDSPSCPYCNTKIINSKSVLYIG